MALCEKKKKILLSIGSLVVLALFWGVLFVFVGRPMLEMVGDIEGFRAWVEAKGILGRLLFIGFVVLQVVVSIIPSEPLELGAGYAFGAVEGTILCVIGLALGSALIFLFVRKCGRRLVEFFISREKIDSLSFLRTEARLKTLTFLLYFIPGTPKDVVTWVIPLTRLSFGDFILISTVARLFSVVTSTVSGSALGEEKYLMAAIVMGVTAIVSGTGYLIWRKMQKKHKERDK